MFFAHGELDRGSSHNASNIHQGSEGGGGGGGGGGGSRSKGWGGGRKDPEVGCVELVKGIVKS